MKLRPPSLSPTVYGLGGFMVFLAVVGPFLPIAYIAILIGLLVYMGFAYSINLITGMTGYVSFGHVMFVGIGAYALSAGVEELGLSPFLGVLLGAGLGLGFAAAIGLVTLRFRGVYFAIATLVLALAAVQVVTILPGLGGGEGFIMNLGFHPLDWYYSIWAILIAEILVTVWVTHGRLGYGVRAIKSDEDAARAVGVDATRLKLILFSLSGLFAGATGAVSAWTQSGILPDTAFNLGISLFMLAMIIIGGMGTELGPLLGAFAVYLPSYYFLTVVVGGQGIVIGLLVIPIALFIPEGIVGALRRYVPQLQKVLE